MGHASDAEWARARWQEAGGSLCAVLRAVFAWLAARELARAGAVCRAWRTAADDPPLWRRLLRARGVADTTLRALRRYYPSISWRQEYINVCARWELVRRLPAESEVRPEEIKETSERPHGGSAPLSHAALDAAGTRLALAADNGAFSIWQRIGSSWHEEWSTDLRSRGWSSAVRAEWTPAESEAAERGAGGTGGTGGAGGARVLLTGALALADRWELLVLQRDEYGSYRCSARAGCSAGAGGCWAGAAAFVSLELSRLAPRLALTVVWLNAATQETQSEYTGVTTPLLRIFNEDSAHLTHVLVADVPFEALKIANDVVTDEEQCTPGFEYYCALDATVEQDVVQTLVTASHGAGGGLRSWGVRARRVPPLPAAAPGELAARARRRRLARAEPAPEPGEPDEATVRAMCDPPQSECYLHAAILGLVLHPSRRCAWASTADGRAWCVSLPALARLRVLRGAAGAFPGDHYYVQPAASARRVSCPAAGRAGRVRLWAAASGAASPRPPQPPHPAGPALVCLLPPQDDELFVLAGHFLYIWRSSATPQPGQYQTHESRSSNV